MLHVTDPKLLIQIQTDSSSSSAKPAAAALLCSFCVWACGVWVVVVFGQGDVTLRKVANWELLMVRGTICFQRCDL